MATTTDLEKLVINYLTQDQYDDAREAGTLNANELYLTPDTGSTNSDEKLGTDAVTSGTTYYIVAGTNTTGAERKKYDASGIAYKATNGTANGTNGEALLTLGNSTASTSANWKAGKIFLYSSSAYGGTLVPEAVTSSSKTWTLPNKTGTIALTSDIPDTSSFITVDEKLKWTASTTSSTYYPIQSTSTAATSTASTLNAVSFYQYYNTAGGYRRLDLGNATSWKSTGGAYGTIRLYGAAATYYGDLVPGVLGTTSGDGHLTANRTWTFPDASGIVALTSNIPDISGKIDTAGTGLSKSGTTLNHSNSVTAQTTQAVYPIKIDAQGHISAYGTAVTIPTVPGIATNTTAGLVKPWYYWQQSSTGPTAGTVNSSATVNARSATAGRYYPIEIDKDGRMFVNVPWTNENSAYITTDTNTTYTLSGALSSHKFTSTLTPSSGTATTSDFTLAAGTGITITDTTNTRTMTIACSVTNTDTKVTQAYSTASNSYPLLMTATAGISSTSSRGDTTSILNNQIYANPSTGTITATAFSGAAAATTAYTTANLKNIVESTSDPGTASDYPTGTIWIKYTA